MTDKVTIIDNYQIKDLTTSDLNYKLIQLQSQSKYPIQGMVRLIKDKKPITDFMSNLVVAPGRRFVAQRLFNKIYAGDPDTRSYVVTHFGLGNGGSTITGGIVSLNGPDSCDDDLYTPIQLAPGDSNYLTSPTGTNFVCKEIESDGTVEIVENTTLACSSSYYTWIKCTCYKAIGEPTDLVAGGNIRIDEATLYYVNSSTTYTFAHICFPPKWIEKESELILEWYILC